MRIYLVHFCRTQVLFYFDTDMVLYISALIANEVKEATHFAAADTTTYSHG